MPAANDTNAGTMTGCGPTRSKARPVKGRVTNMARAYTTKNPLAARARPISVA